MSILAQVFGWLFLDVLFGSIMDLRSSSNAKKLFAKIGHVASSIRAVEGRVLNIGTEWSVGVAELSVGHVRFVPRMGIVGNREIDVLDVQLARLPIMDLPVTTSPSQLLLVTTSAGGLYWLVPMDLVDEIVQLLRPTDPQGAVA